ncbi:site-specific integrase [Thalassotalea agarivorans]|uniref:Phage integrase family protein n=1 Tax=Thalassotalea agarivorans TaxID=349064 RepID=A0A1H9ZKN7_THASX|nr:site-specific integrase [Thalassotalea agarivorans]SES81681.1 Phage integrase family protein [Thalassotalea agarivorans]
MKLEQAVQTFKDYNKIFSEFKYKYRWEDIHKDKISPDIQALTLLNYQVSDCSLFKDIKWSFNQERKAKQDFHHTKSDFEIDFTNYPCIPPFILFEGKVAFLLAKVLPSKELSGSKRTSAPLKTITLVVYFKGWLKALNEGFSSLVNEYGDVAIFDQFESLGDLKKAHHKLMFSNACIADHTAYNFNRFQKLFNSKKIRESVLPEGYVPISLKSFGFNVRKNSENKEDKENPNAVMPDDVFESCVSASSYIVLDFLQKLNVNVKDSQSIKLFSKYTPFFSEPLLNVNDEIISQYAAYRLKRAGYNIEHIIATTNIVTPPSLNQLNKKLSKLNSGDVLASDLYRYLDLIKSSSLYLINQLTGMRRSEMMNLRVDTKIVEEFGISLITSKVKKQRSFERSLFDDKWVCIPIVADAINAIRIIYKITNNPFMMSGGVTTKPHKNPQALMSGSRVFKRVLFNSSTETNIPFHGYTLRNTLAYQLFKADLGLPFISHQLKHFCNVVTHGLNNASNKGFSESTLGYGDIGDRLSGKAEFRKGLRKKAEIESIKISYDPDANYAGENGAAHKEKMTQLFSGYMAQGYSKEQIFEAMADQGMAIVNVGNGMCYGGKMEDFDSSLPCIGGLRCNPVRCSNAVVTKAHAPKWREIYRDNMIVVNMGQEATGYESAIEATKEAALVLNHLGEEV